MKKCFLFLSIAATALSITHVSAYTGEYRFSPEGHVMTSFMNNLFETEDAVYMFDPARHLMTYLDESDMTWYPLCNRPECLHTVDETTMTSDCNAFINTFFTSGFVYWKGRLYYYEQPSFEPVISLCSMNPDGTDHKKELEIEYTSAVTPFLHNGRAYIDMDYQGEQPCQTFMYDLDRLKQEPVLIREGEEALSPSFYGDWIYYGTVDVEAERQDIYRMSLDGTENELLADDIHFDITLDQDYACQYLDDSLVVYDFEAGEERTLWENEGRYGDSFRIKFDGQYFYLRSPQDGTFLILDNDGMLLEELKIPDNQKKIEEKEEEFFTAQTSDEITRINNELLFMQLSTYALVGVSRDYIFVTDEYMPTYYIERSEIGSGTCEWKPIRVYTEKG